MKNETTLETVGRLIHEVIGEEMAFADEIRLDTSFSQDLELESIEFVALAERLQAHYGTAVDFVGWLSGMELDRIIRLTVGDLVEHIDRCL